MPTRGQRKSKLKSAVEPHDDHGDVRFPSPGCGTRMGEGWMKDLKEDAIRNTFALKEPEFLLYREIINKTADEETKTFYASMCKSSPRGSLVSGPDEVSTGSKKRKAPGSDVQSSTNKKAAKEAPAIGDADQDEDQSAADFEDEFLHSDPAQQLPKCLPIPTNSCFLPNAKVNVGGVNTRVGLIRSLNAETADPVRKGFSNYGNKFDPTKPIWVVPDIEGTKNAHLRQLYNNDPAAFWTKALDGNIELKFLIVDGANRFLVSTELQLPHVYACFLKPEISLQEMVRLRMSCMFCL
jgi:hypothetical protein